MEYLIGSIDDLEFKILAHVAKRYLAIAFECMHSPLAALIFCVSAFRRSRLRKSIDHCSSVLDFQAELQSLKVLNFQTPEVSGDDEKEKKYEEQEEQKTEEESKETLT